MFINKQTYFENHHHQKLSYQEKLESKISTVPMSLFVANVASFNLSSNIVPKKLLVVIYKSQVVIYTE